MTAAYLETLNPEQRRAVEHGVREQDCTPGPPLLVIAGAGSGKTNTLAHRVAHLIVNGADPRRILLMTFSRRAAAEMTRRVERITRRVMGQRADIMTDALAWAGTFHGIGARLLRDYADQIGLDPNFTIHDREDSADLMNLVRHNLGFSKTESRFPTKGTCLAIYSRAVNSEAPLDEVLRTTFPWCAAWEKQLRRAVRGLRRDQASSTTSSITTISCSIGRRRSAIRCSPMTSAGDGTMCWSMNIRTPIAFSPRSCSR